MDDFLIPRISVFLEDMRIWLDHERVSDLTAYIPGATSVATTEDQRDEAITCHGYHSETTSAHPSGTTSKPTDTLFDKKVHNAWRREKYDIKKLMKKHRAIMADLQQLQEKCLKANENLVKRSRAIASQRAVKQLHPTGTAEERIIANIETLESECEGAVMKQARYYDRFQNTLDKETAYRERLQKLTSSLADDIVNKIAAAITRMSKETNQIASAEGIEQMARTILETSSKFYRSKPPTRLPCGQDNIMAPRLYASKRGKPGAAMTDNVVRAALSQ